MNTRIANYAAIALLLIISVFLLIVGRSLLQPLITAIILWYVMVRIASFVQQPTKKIRPLPYSIAFIISLIITFSMMYWFFLSLGHSINNIVVEAGAYQETLKGWIDNVNNWVGGKLNTKDILADISLPYVFSGVALMLSNLAGNISLIFIYLLFIFLEYHTFDKKLRAVCRTRDQYEKWTTAIKQVNSDISKYLKVKTLASALTGFASYIILLAFSVNNAEFWGLFIFLLNFIPTIGAIVAIIITLIAAAVGAPSVMTFIAMSAILISVQLIIGNLIEPKWLGSYLNLSPMIILLSLAFWGKIWGILGMLLCVPLMAVLIIVLGHFKKTRPIAILMSANGEL